MLAYVPQPQDKHFSTIVIEVAPQSGRRYEESGVSLQSYTIFDGKIFSGNMVGPPGDLRMWSGTHFESATSQEKSKFYAAQQRAPQSDDVTDPDGWSKRDLGCGDVAADFSLKVDTENLVVERGCGYTASVDSIDLNRSGKPPQNIWNLSDRFRWVSKSKYKQIFAQR